MDRDTNLFINNGGEPPTVMHKTSAYFRTVVALHNLRDRTKDAVGAWQERSMADRLQSGWTNTRRNVTTRTRKVFSHPENVPCKHIPEKYSYVFRPKSRWELILLSGTVCGIEFCYAAETAFVTPILLSLGLSIKFVTMIWCLSPLIGLFLTPILGSMSDSCESKIGRRRPFIIMYSIGILLGLILVPNGHHIGLALGDKGHQQTSVNENIVTILNGTRVVGTQVKLNQSLDVISVPQSSQNEFSRQVDEEDVFPNVKFKKGERHGTYFKNILPGTRGDTRRNFDDEDIYPNIGKDHIDEGQNTNLDDEDLDDDFSRQVDKEDDNIDFEYNLEGIVTANSMSKSIKTKVSRQNDDEDIIPKPHYVPVSVNLDTNVKSNLPDNKDKMSNQFDTQNISPNIRQDNLGVQHLKLEDEIITENSKEKFKGIKTKRSRQNDEEDTYPNLHYVPVSLNLDTSSKSNLPVTKDKNSDQFETKDIFPNIRYDHLDVQHIKFEDELQDPEDEFSQLVDKENILPHSQNNLEELRSGSEVYSENVKHGPSQNIEDKNTFLNFLLKRPDVNLKSNSKKYTPEFQLKRSRESSGETNPKFKNSQKIKRSVSNSNHNSSLINHRLQFIIQELDSENGSNSSFNKTLINDMKRLKRSVVIQAKNSQIHPRDKVISNHIQPWSIAFTVIGTVLLDFCSDACQSPSRTYLLDVSIPSDHAAGLSTFTVMAGLGGSIGYAMGALHWETTFLGRLLGGQVNAVFMIVTIIFLICLLTTVFSFPEIPLGILKDPKMYNEYQEKYQVVATEVDGSEMAILGTKLKRYGSTDKTIGMENIVQENSCINKEVSSSQIKQQSVETEAIQEQSNEDLYESIPDQQISTIDVPAAKASEINVVEELGSNEHPTLKEYLISIVRMPRSLRVLCLTNLFCWMSLVCYSLYFTDFVGECVYGGDPRAAEDSPSYKLYHEGVQFGCWGMALYSLSCSIYSLFIDSLIKKIGAKTTYVGGQLVYSAGMVIMGITRHKAAVILLSPTAGIMYSTLFTMPYLLIAHYHCSKQFSDVKTGSENKNRGIGTDVAAVSSMVFLSQFILSLSMGSIVEAIGSNVVPVCAAALLSACGALAATQVTYLDI